MLINLTSRSQQDPQYTMYMFNMMSINPAYAGSIDRTDVTLLGRKQWVNYPGSPQTINFNLHTPFYYDKMGAGISIINDQLGIMKHNMINLAYSYHVKLKTSIVSFGIQSSITQFNSNFSNIKLDAPGTTAIPDNAFNTLNQFDFKTGAGFFWYSNKMFFGASSPLLYKYKISGTTAGNLTPYDSRSHFFITGGYVFNLKNNNKLKPSTLIKYTKGAPLEFDINCNLYFNEMFGFGLSWRSFDSMDAILEYLINKNLKIGYSYDYTLTKLSKYNTGSHEIMLNWQFGFKKGKIITPRYF